MAGSVNKVILVGNLGKDPEIRSMGDGARVASISLATSESWKDRQSGEKRERTEWHRVSVFGALVNVIEKFCAKGDKIYIEGKMETRKWTDNSGQDRYTTEVVLRPYSGSLTLLSTKRGGEGQYSGEGEEQGQGYGAQGGQGGRGGHVPATDLDDEIPF